MPVVKLEKNKDTQKKSGLLVGNPIYKPFRYPWCYDAWLTQQRIHWLPEEVPLGDDVRDWQKSLNPAEKNLLTHIFRFFTQADVEVSNCYIRHYMNVFKPYRDTNDDVVICCYGKCSYRSLFPSIGHYRDARIRIFSFFKV